MKDTHSKILSVIDTLDKNGILDHMAGNCILASDVIQNMLHTVDVSSRIVECQLLITCLEDHGRESVCIVGYDFPTPNAAPGKNLVDTHAVTVTQGDTAYLIDISIGNFLGNPKYVIVSDIVTDDSDPDVFARASVGPYKLVYRKKKHLRLPNLHQKNLVDRVQQEYQLLKNVRYLKYLVIFAIAISGMNAIRGSYDFYNKYSNDNKLVGVSANTEIINRLSQIEQKLNSR
jgi:hypothetical protein